MRVALEAFEEAVPKKDGVSRLSATANFCRIMQQGGGNRLIEELLQRLMVRINFLRSQSMSQVGRAKFSAREMQAIFQAISNGDSDSARRAAEAHVSNAAIAAHAVFD